jgi:hypothetical protein
LIAGRTAAPAATKRTSGFAHAVVVWLRRKVVLEWLTGTADITHAKSGTFILFGMARYKSCARARMVLSTAGNVQQQVEWYDAVHGLSSVVTADFGLSVTFAFTILKQGAVGFAAGAWKLSSRITDDH